VTERPLIFGIVNTTPDSFSDGGLLPTVDAAVAHAVALVEAGADVIDVGGESTRPGARRVSLDEEQRRVLPVIGELASRGIVVSVDTMNAATARAAIAAGAWIVNDVSGGLADERMAAVIADTDARYVAMHWRGHSTEMADRARYDDVVGEVRDELAERLEALERAGVARDRIVLDPGIGFAKTAQHNWAVLAGLDRIASLGAPLLVGASRKRFLGELPVRAPSGRAGDAASLPVLDRDLPTAVISALAANAGVWAVRVHDAASTATALDVVDALAEAQRGSAEGLARTITEGYRS
jgi:dihydropteroate synthase